MSTGLAVEANGESPRGFVEPDTAPSPTLFKRLIMFAFAGAAFTAGTFVVTGLVTTASSVVRKDVRVANLQTSGLFGDIVEGRLINEGAGGEIYVWVEWNGEPACAHHTYLRADSEYKFSFLCGRMTLNLGGEVAIFTSRSPPEWAQRTAVSL